MCELNKERGGCRRLTALSVLCWEVRVFVTEVRLEAAHEDIRSVNSFEDEVFRDGSRNIQSEYARHFREFCRGCEGLLAVEEARRTVGGHR